jgi:SAM-dependent methyltransferase
MGARLPAGGLTAPVAECNYRFNSGRLVDGKWCGGFWIVGGRTLDGGADLVGYRWHSAAPTCAHAYLWPAVQRILADGVANGRARRVFDLGCGNGASARVLAADGWEVAGSILRRKVSGRPGRAVSISE